MVMEFTFVRRESQSSVRERLGKEVFVGWVS